MSEVTTQPKPKRTRRNRNRKQKKKGAQTQRSKGVQLGDHIAGWKSVRRGLAAVPETSSAYIRAVLDPAHIMDYGCKGIPDDNKYPTLTYRNGMTRGFPTSFQPVNPNNTTLEDTISHVDIWITDFPGSPLWYVAHSSTNGSTLYFARQADPATKQAIGTRDYRLVARGATITQVGPRAQRGGYYVCYRPVDNTELNSSADKFYWNLDLDSCEANFITTFDGDEGVYLSLIPTQLNWNKEFRKVDDSESITVTSNGTNYTLNAAETGLYTCVKDFPWHWSVVRYVPTTPFTIKRTSTTQALATDLDTQLWNMRITLFTQLEMISDRSITTDQVMNDPATTNILYALTEHHQGFYPARYNDWRKVLADVKATYHKYKPAIDVAAGYIPYGSTVNSFLSKLLA